MIDNAHTNNSSRFTFEDIIGESILMKQLKSYALKAAELSSPVFIYGETGTGKELVVQAIHNSSKRKSKPFIAQNCAAFPDGLLEGILFGTVKGSFTGAEDRPGLFEIANEGTLYLDELNSMPMALQSKLLRVLQDGCIRRVGDVQERKVNVRVIASTNIEPEYCVNNGIIRKDLYFRINVISLKIPELRNRKSDIPVLIKHFILKLNSKMGVSIKGVSNDALEKLAKYNWPGNIRELENVLEGTMNIKGSGIIEECDLPEGIRDTQNKTLFERLEEYEIKIILEALKLWNNNISKSAKYLGIPRQTLQNKIKKYNLLH
jgi:arginine utilization regulatory protein